ncbi:heme-containing dehydratase, partial [Penicillium waksmanii]|uniref:heme-containing dehydratase n=1 Tax=Penicillium waksmanii TaxID=69791 RepID=UPI002546E3BD
KPGEVRTLKGEFHDLIASHTAHLDLFVQNHDGCAAAREGKPLIWLGYWESRTSYLAWWDSEKVSNFWDNLPVDAGMWREIMSPDSSRTQYITNKSEPVGLSHLGTEISVGDKIGYWGCYRHRMAAHSNDNFDSPIERDLEAFKPIPDSLGGDRPGRILMTKFPDNICFVVEVLTGILGSRMCYAPETGVYRDSTPKALNYNEKAQLFYFKDLQHMEKIGRTNKGHAALRSHFMRAYSPNSAMESGKLVLWVETTVLSNGEIECEYVGCEKGTGWMALAGHQESW